MADPTRPIVAVVLSFDRATLLYTLPIAVAASFLLTLLVFRKRRPWELVSLFIASTAIILALVFVSMYLFFSIAPPGIDVVAWESTRPFLGED